MIKFTTIQDDLKTLHEVMAYDFEKYESNEGSGVFEIDWVTRNGEEYDMVGVKINIQEKSFGEISLVSDGGETIEPLTETDIKEIKSQLVEAGIFNYTVSEDEILLGVTPEGLRRKIKMKLTKKQKEFINNVINTEKKLNKKLWLKWIDKKWAMGTHEDESTLFYVDGRLVKSLTNNEILTNAEFKNKWGSMLTGMTLNDEFRNVQLVG
jgi:hypothetical protein